MTSLTVALAGNPNTGKSTLFNNLTGLRQHVGNYPGVTVTLKEGFCSAAGVQLRVVDLPGTYSLTATSPDELDAATFIVEQRPEVVVAVVDASNLERNLYLTTQLMELGRPVVVALNMTDVAQAKGMRFDLARLSALLGVPVVPMVASKNVGTRELLETIVRVACEGNPPPPPRYGTEVEEELMKLEALVAKEDVGPYPPRWVAIRLLEGDEGLWEKVGPGVRDQARKSSHHLEKVFGAPPALLLAERRYGFISGACQEAVSTTAEIRHTLSDAVDVVMTNPLVGLAIFLVLMYGVFSLVFSVGGPLSELLARGLTRLGTVLAPSTSGTRGPLERLLVEGVLGGVGEVLALVPNVFLLFLVIAVLEDTGYMARAAFLMDRFMHRVGLHGRSFIPFILGFGCTVPAVMATRILESRRDRLTTILVLPLMSCGGRFATYSLLVGAFFPPSWRAPMLWAIYLTGMALGLLGAKLLRSTAFRGESTPLVMELPPYRMPTLRGLAIHTWERGREFVKKAGTFILAVSVLMWVGLHYPEPRPQPGPQMGTPPATHAAQDGRGRGQAVASALTSSAVGRVGQALARVLSPLGFDWRIATCLLGSLPAREAFVAHMGILFAVEEGDVGALARRLRETYPPLTAVCLMVFTLVGMPCIPTLVVTWRESGSWRWAAWQAVGLTGCAYVLTLAVYRVGLVLGLGTGVG